MGFLDTLRNWDTPRPKPAADSARAEFLSESLAVTEFSDYDREQWRKKLKRLLSSMPQSESEWPDLHQEAAALGFDQDWLKKTSRQEFALLVRKIVSDREVTSEEHQSLDRARSLLGIPDHEAETIFHTIVAEAETFFGSEVRGG